jgi:hemerythrin-like domain-containing protein
MNAEDTRRAFLTLAGTGTLLAACRRNVEPDRVSLPASASVAALGPTEADVSATEDLMREHGVIRRVLVVYRLSAQQLRAKPAAVPLPALHRAAELMRTFAEEYHEKQLEEAQLFPALKKAGGAAAAEIDTLLIQHERGREITDYLLAVTKKALAGNAEPLAHTLETFALMYEAHAAREDTIVFPAWKKALSPQQLHEMGELFEDIEHKTLGKDGFDDAVAQIETIERAFELDGAALTAPPPPRA